MYPFFLLIETNVLPLPATPWRFFLTKQFIMTIIRLALARATMRGVHHGRRPVLCVVSSIHWIYTDAGQRNVYFLPEVEKT